MKNTRTSYIWKIPRDEFINILNKSLSMKEVLLNLNFDYKGASRKTVEKRMKEENLDIIAYKKKWKQNNTQDLNNFIQKKKRPLSEILVENSPIVTNWHLRNRLINEGVLENICSICNNGVIWNNLPLSLQLDHKNGINNDNRLENLRLLCPNCHSQTETFSGRNIKRGQGFEPCS